jgi:L-asparaginase
MKQKKLCLIFAGGTIGMTLDPNLNTLKPMEGSFELMQQIPELHEIADIGFESVVNIDSSSMQPSHWTQISETIRRLYDDYDGFVVAHGTDTMAYTASAISFALQGLNKPVVFTGSLIPLSEIGSDARNNLIYACMTACLDIAEVCIVIANQILRGNRSKKHHESIVAAFHSPGFPEIGELGRPIIIKDWCCKKNTQNILNCQSAFNPNVSLLKLYPGFNPEAIEYAIKRGVEGIVIEAFGPGNIPCKERSLLPVIEKAIQAKIPVVITNQMGAGTTKLTTYEAGLGLHKIGAITSKEMTTEATITKLMWVLAQNLEFDKIKELMEQNLAGELN